jgi:ATP-dependent protease ClpP protease subunit
VRQKENGAKDDRKKHVSYNKLLEAIKDMKEWKEVNQILFNLLGGYCGKKPEQVMKDATRDFWLSADEAVKYGIIDEVVLKKKKK